MDDLVQIGDPADGSLDPANFSFSAWVLTTGFGTFDSPIFKGGTGPGPAGYAMELGLDLWNGTVHDGSGVQRLAFGDEVDFRGAWTHLVAVVDSRNGMLLVYVNGVKAKEASLSIGPTAGSTNPLLFGGDDQGGNEFFGRLDEVRIGPVRSAAWIEAEWRNGNDPAFCVVSPP